jgi:hypothetical protein
MIKIDRITKDRQNVKKGKVAILFMMPLAKASFMMRNMTIIDKDQDSIETNMRIAIITKVDGLTLVIWYEATTMS